MGTRMLLGVCLAVGAATCVTAADEAEVSAVVRQLLDENAPQEERVAIVRAHPDLALNLLREMTRNLEPGKEEYRRIPWIWRVTIEAARRNTGDQVREILVFSLPEDGEPLRDWQAVVIGGGVINGLSLQDIWPREHIAKLLEGDAALQARWERLLVQAGEMADDEKVPTGTRYDALRILGCGTWSPHGEHLLKYLPAGTHEELQMGAVSGLVDIDAPQAAQALLDALVHLQGTNRNLALEGLIRGEERAGALLDVLADNAIKPQELTPEQIRKLREHESPEIRARAARVLPQKSE